MRNPYVICSVLVLSITLARPISPALASEPSHSKLTVQIVIEQQKGDEWERVDAQKVFHSGDTVRFRFRASRGGYLYVLDRSSDKTTAWLFPHAGSEESKVAENVEYLIPEGQGAFEVAGSPGFDVTYWILSPTPIDRTATNVPTSGDETSTLEPRCRTEVLRARGLCTDERAGPQPLTNSGDLPLQPPESDKLKSRDLKFKTEEGATEITGLTNQSDVVVYEFKIAHN